MKFLYCLIAIAALCCISQAQGLSVHPAGGLTPPAQEALNLFSSPMISPEIQLFETSPPLPFFEQVAQGPSINFFGDAESCSEVKVQRSSGQGADTPRSEGKPSTPAEPPLPPVEPDTRPVIHAYSIDTCVPCKANEKEVGDGDSRCRVVWHHAEDGEAHPWHIHNFAKSNQYPVFHYPEASGKWKRTSGRHSIDALAALVKSQPSEMVSKP